MYCRLLYAVQRGYRVFVEVLAAATWLGGAIIIASTINIKIICFYNYIITCCMTSLRTRINYNTTSCSRRFDMNPRSASAFGE